MATNISLDKLITLFNRYMTSTDKDFITFATNGRFLTATPDADPEKPAILEFNDDTINPIVGAINLSKTITKDDNKKLTEIYNFLYTYISVIDDSLEVTKEGFLQDLTRKLIQNDVRLNFDEASAKKIVETFNLGELNPKLRKMKSKTNWVAKKVVVPTIITATLAGLAGCVIGGIGAIAGSSILWSGNVLLGFASVGGLGAIAGLALTPTIILLKNGITRLYYKSKYGTKNAMNLKNLVDSGVSKVDEIESKSELENLPILKLINKIEESESKLIKFKKSGSKNPFKKMSAYFRRKTNRNRIHELIAFKNMLAKRAEVDGIDAKEKQAYDAMLGYINNFIENDEIRNYALSIEKNSVIENLDIFARNLLSSKKEKRKASLVREEARKITQNLSARFLTNNTTPSNMLVKISNAYSSKQRKKPKIKVKLISTIEIDENVLNYLEDPSNIDNIVSLTDGKISEDDIKGIQKTLKIFKQQNKKLGGDDKKVMLDSRINDVKKAKYEIIARIMMGEDFADPLSKLSDPTPAVLVVS